MKQSLSGMNTSKKSHALRWMCHEGEMAGISEAIFLWIFYWRRGSLSKVGRAVWEIGSSQINQADSYSSEKMRWGVAKSLKILRDKYDRMRDGGSLRYKRNRFNSEGRIYQRNRKQKFKGKTMIVREGEYFCFKCVLILRGMVVLWSLLGLGKKFAQPFGE